MQHRANLKGIKRTVESRNPVGSPLFTVDLRKMIAAVRNLQAGRNRAFLQGIASRNLPGVLLPCLDRRGCNKQRLKTLERQMYDELASSCYCYALAFCLGPAPAEHQL